MSKTMKPAHTVPVMKRRARKPKVKTGCGTCKERRVKCDEAFPACLKCSKTGRKCKGYGAKTTGALVPLEHDVFLDPITRLPFAFPCNEQERRTFHFFSTKIASEIAGFLTSDFWNKLILQASHDDPAIFHAVIALGSAHETYEGEGPGHFRHTVLAPQDFAREQYTKALANIRIRLSSGKPQSGEYVLISCILFICLETFQGNHKAALVHLESGLKLLGSWLHEDGQPVLSSDHVSRPSQRFLEEELVPLFTRLDIQATTYLTSRSLRELSPGSSTTEPIMPTRFKSLTDANNHLSDLVHWMLYSNNGAHNMMYWMVNNPLAQLNISPPQTTMADDSLPLIPDRVWKKIMKIETEHKRILKQWLTALNHFLNENPNKDTKDLRGALMLRILYTSTTIIKAASLYNHDLEYDKYIPKFERVITWTESLIKFQSSATEKHTPLYSFEMNILPPLHYCSTRCRDPKLRRRALALLEDTPRREGMWDSAMLAAIARYIMEEEEAGLGEVFSAEQIPAQARICILDKVPMLEEKKCWIQYCKGVRNPYAMLDIKETLIAW